MSSLCHCGHSGWDHYLLRGECDKRKLCQCLVFKADGNYVPPKPYHLGSSEKVKMNFRSLDIFSLVDDALLNAACSFVKEEHNMHIIQQIAFHRMAQSDFIYEKPWNVLRAFLFGAIYQKLFGNKIVGSSTVVACVAHINTELPLGYSPIGSSDSVIEAMQMTPNHPNSKGPFTSLARAFMTGAKWTTGEK